MIKLGQEVKDKVTGFAGVAISRTEWINGCARVMVQPKVDKDGKIPDVHQFDEPQLEVVSEGTYRPDQVEAAAEDEIERKTGGPAPMPRRAGE